MSANINNQIEKLHIANKKVDDIFNSELKKHPDFLNNKKYPNTTQTLWDYIKCFDSLYAGVSDLAKTSNLYCIKILYRSFIEHYLTEHYLIDKTLLNKSDEVSEQFAKHNLISEYLMYERAQAKAESIKDSGTTKVDLQNYISNKYEEMKDFDKSNQAEISNAIKQFSIDNIILHFYNNWQAEGNLQFDGTFFLKFIPDYSQLSSFTHGGPYASKLMKVYEREEKIDEEIDAILTVAFIGSVNVKENLVLLLSENDPKTFLDFHKQTSAIRDFAVEHFKQKKVQ